jgi:hypothetical protein
VRACVYPLLFLAGFYTPLLGAGDWRACAGCLIGAAAFALSDWLLEGV